MPKRGMDKVRKPQLIAATMKVIDEVGFQATTVAQIGQAASVSPGIINHYFGGKDGLIEATMRSVLKELSSGIKEQLETTDSSDVIGRLRAIVRGNFTPHQLDRRVVKTWLTFWAHAMHHPTLYRLQRVNDKRLQSYLRRELKQILPPERAIFVATGIAGLIDGIWLRGVLNPQGIDARQALEIVDDYLQRQLPAELFAQHDHLIAQGM